MDLEELHPGREEAMVRSAAGNHGTTLSNRVSRKLPLLLAFGVLVCLFSCRGSEPKPHSDWDAVLKLGTEDPAAALVELQSLPKGQEQLMLFDVLLEQDGPSVVALCEIIEPGPVRQRCDRVQKRRHLWDGEQLRRAWKRKRQQQGKKVTPRIAVGPSSFLLNPIVDSTWSPITAASEVPCEKPDRNVTCVTRLAMRQVKKGKLRKAASLCSVLLVDSIWRSDCVFESAERAVHTQGRSGYRDATELCLLSEEYRERCLANLVRILSTWTPGANQLTSKNWAAVEKTEQVLRDTWQDRDPDYMELELNRFWSSVMYVAYKKTDVITGNPLNFVDPRWHLHVRSAAAYRLVELEGEQERSLGEWTDRLEDVLTLRVGVDPAAQNVDFRELALSTGRKLWPWAPIWHKDRPGDEEIPSTYYLGRTRRTFSEDARVDASICVLEALFLQKADVQGFLAEAQAHPDPSMNWTGKQLGAYKGCQKEAGCNLSNVPNEKSVSDNPNESEGAAPPSR